MGKPPLAADQDKFVLRLPEGMRERIKVAADANNRSMNAEIVARLEATDAASKALENAVDGLEQVTAQYVEMVEVMKWMRQQQDLSASIIETVASTDGHLSDDFMSALKAMVATKGKATGFPPTPVLDALRTEAPHNRSKK